jgi:hypothetical protein
MRVFTVMVCVTTLSLGRQEAQDKPATQDHGPPRFVVIAKVDKASATITYRDRVSDVDSLAELSEKLRGRKQPDMDAFLKLMGGDLNVPRDLSFALKKGKVYTVGGTELPPDESLKRLPPGSIAIVSTTGKNIDLAYRKVLQKDAIVLVPPRVRDLPALPPPPKKEPKR